MNRNAMVKADPKVAYANIEALVVMKREDIVTTLPPGINPDHFINVALQAVTRQPKLLDCTPASIVKCLRDAAELGLEPSGLMGQAYMVPYKTEARLLPGYRGLIDLARRSGEVQTVEARVVRERDFFEFEYGTNQRIIHRPYMNLTAEREPDGQTEMGETTRGKLVDAGEYVAAFARAVLTTGAETFDVMSIAEVNAIRSRSQASGSGPWVTDYVEMARKTVARRLLKYLPLSSVRLQKALELEDAFEGEGRRLITTSPAQAQLQASILAPDAPEPPETDGSPEAGQEDGIEQSAPQEGVRRVCGQPNDEGIICGRAPDHEGPHADDDDPAIAEAIWPNNG